MNTGSRSLDWGLGGAGIAMIGVSYGFARYGYGLFEPEIREDYSLSVAASGAIASGAYVGYVVALSAVALLASRVGPRPLIMAAGVTATVGMAVVVVAEKPWHLLVGLVVAGASSGFAWAPYSDAIDQLVHPARRHSLLAAIPSGTAFGITVAGGLALSEIGETWRQSWMGFCVLAALATACNLWFLRTTRPVTRHGDSSCRISPRFFLRTGTRALYLTAFSYGIVGAVYWTFAVAVVAHATAHTASALFWVVIGLAGITAIGSGWLFAKLGLRLCHTLLLGGLAASSALIATAPAWWPAIAASAVVYGASFMATSGLLSVWSYRMFPDRPSVGFSGTVFFLGLGAVVGPVLFGTVAEASNLRAALLMAAGLAAITTTLRPAAESRPREPTIAR